MKNLLIAILLFVMVFVLIASMSAYATENDDSEGEELLALARQAFPEYIELSEFEVDFIVGADKAAVDIYV